MSYRFESRIRYSEIGENGCLTLPALLDYFQEVLRNGGINKLQTELEEWISDWETENHSDDKTLCYLAIKKGVVQ